MNHQPKFPAIILIILASLILISCGGDEEQQQDYTESVDTSAAQKAIDDANAAMLKNASRLNIGPQITILSPAYAAEITDSPLRIEWTSTDESGARLITAIYYREIIPGRGASPNTGNGTNTTPTETTPTYAQLMAPASDPGNYSWDITRIKNADYELMIQSTNGVLPNAAFTRFRYTQGTVPGLQGGAGASPNSSRVAGDTANISLNGSSILSLTNGVTSSELTFSSTDGVASIRIPKNTRVFLSDGRRIDETSIQVKGSANQNKAIPLDYTFYPANLTFDPPITLEFSFNDKDHDGLVDGTSIKTLDLVISYQAYPHLSLNLPSKVDTANNKITAKTPYFSTYTIDSRQNRSIGLANIYPIDPLTTPVPISVELPELDGTGYLKGRFADVANLKHGSEPIPTPRVKKPDLNFMYRPIPFGDPNYWGNDDISDEGHRFDQASVYFYTTIAANYFHDHFGFKPKKGVLVGLYDTSKEVGHIAGPYTIHGSMPIKGQTNGHRGIKGWVHEYTHLVQFDLSPGPWLRRNNPEDDGLAESFPKYFEAALTNIPYDPYNFNPATGIKDFSDYNRWQYRRNIGKEIGFVIPSAWWHLRQEIGERVTDRLVYESMKHITPKSCGALDALEGTLKSDEALFAGRHRSTIITIFSKHNIHLGKCYVITR